MSAKSSLACALVVLMTAGAWLWWRAQPSPLPSVPAAASRPEPAAPAAPLASATPGPSAEAPREVVTTPPSAPPASSEALLVKVIDDGGAPAPGVDVVIVWDEHVAARVPGLARARAGNDGIARLVHLEAINPAIRQHLTVVLDVPARAPIFALVDLDRPPPQPIVLQLPGAGEVRVTLVDASGATYLPCAPETLRIDAAIDADQPNGRRVPLAFDGSARCWILPRVTLGLPLSITVDAPDCAGSAAIVGPQRSKQIVTTAVPVTLIASFRGRLVDGAGEPQRNASWTAKLECNEATPSCRFTSDEEGRFHFAPFDGVTSADLADCTLRIGTDGGGDVSEAKIELARLALRPSCNDLGDVVLQPEPFLVSGVAVDDQGHGVAKATIHIVSSDDPTAGHPFPGGTTGPDGTFVVRGYLPGDRMSLAIRRRGYTGAVTPFTRGTTGMRYEMISMGELQARVQLRDALRPEQLLFVTRRLASGWVQAKGGAEVLRDGVFRWPDLVPDDYQLIVRVAGAPEDLVSRSGIHVPGGEITQLADIDVEAGLRCIRVTAKKASGAPIECVAVLVEPADDADRPREALTSATDTVEVWTSRPTVSLRVFAPGHAEKALRDVARDVEVQLEPGFPVTIEVAFIEGAALERRDQLRPEVRRRDEAWTRGAATPNTVFWWPQETYRMVDQDTSSLWRECTVEAQSRFTVRVPAPGEYDVRWHVSGPAGASVVQPQPPLVFRVAPGDRTPVVRAEITADQLHAVGR